MKRTTKSKIYELIGRAFTFITAYIVIEIALYNLCLYILNNCITTIR